MILLDSQAPAYELSCVDLLLRIFALALENSPAARTLFGVRRRRPGENSCSTAENQKGRC